MSQDWKENKIKTLKSCFQALDEEVIRAIFESMNGDVDKTVEQLVELNKTTVPAPGASVLVSLSTSPMGHQTLLTSLPGMRQSQINSSPMPNGMNPYAVPSAYSPSSMIPGLINPYQPIPGVPHQGPYSMIPMTHSLSSMAMAVPSAPAAYDPIELPSKAKLTVKQLSDFKARGHLVLPHFIPTPDLDAALRAINRSIGKGIATTAKTLTHCPELVTTRVITNLFTTTGLRELLAGLVGPVQTPLAGKIQISFPGDGCVEPDATLTKAQNLETEGSWQWSWQMDGIPSTELVPRERWRNYSILVGIALTDHPIDNCGNFSVKAGEHRRVAEYLAENIQTSYEEILARGIDCRRLITPGMDQLFLQRGDVILCHHHLPTATAPNTTATISYMVYFKVYTEARKAGSLSTDALRDTWFEFDSIKAL